MYNSKDTIKIFVIKLTISKFFKELLIFLSFIGATLPKKLFIKSKKVLTIIKLIFNKKVNLKKKKKINDVEYIIIIATKKLSYTVRFKKLTSMRLVLQSTLRYFYTN